MCVCHMNKRLLTYLLNDSIFFCRRPSEDYCVMYVCVMSYNCVSAVIFV